MELYIDVVEKSKRSCFFLQAEDGILVSSVTGVQTCALPISASGTYPARQQYLPGAVSAGPLTLAEVALPATTAVAPPTCVPPVGHPAGVTWPGAHRKNDTVPVGTGRVPTAVTDATSCWADPGATSEPPGVAVVVIGGGGQVLNCPPAKSFSVAVSCAEERVSARNVVKHPPAVPSSVVRSIPASTNVFDSWLVADQGLDTVTPFAMAQALSFAGPPQTAPLVCSTSTPFASSPVHR